MVDYKRLENESERIKSFTESWPHLDIDVASLVKEGLFLLQTHDTVQCAFCKAIISNWIPGCNPYDIHRNVSPSCPFLQTKMTIHNNIEWNSPIQLGSHRENNTSTENVNDVTSIDRYSSVMKHNIPIHPSFITQEARLKTFLSWPQTSSQSPENLANSGFFYVGFADKVCCFYGNCRLYDWCRTDIPWEEHRKHYPDCPFVKLQECDTSKSYSLINNTGDQNHLEDETVDLAMHSNMVQAFLKANNKTPAYLVRLAIIRHFQKTGTKVNTIDDLCEAIHKAENDDYPSSLCKPLTANSTESLDTTTITPTCRICFNEPISYLFLPCKHCCACVNCVIHLSQCVICRVPIEAILRIFIS